MKNMLREYNVIMIIAIIVGLAAYIVGDPIVLAIALYTVAYVAVIIAFYIAHEEEERKD